MTLQEPQLFFNNLNKQQFVVYFRIPVYGAGKVDDVAAQVESSPPVRTSAAREREAKGRLRTLKGQEQSGPLGPVRPNASAGRHRQDGSERNLEAS
jgi:hypothetical protein